MTHHVAQYNIARARAELDDRVMSDFVTSLERINALADASPGFVWRLTGERGNTMDIRPYQDKLILITLSVWRSIDALVRFAYSSEHRDLLRARGRWFHPPATPSLVLWWLPVGQVPSVGEARQRMERLSEHGPTDLAFTFRSQFAAPGVEVDHEAPS
jgi:hypothetical protein